jgi:hypothetical protein
VPGKNVAGKNVAGKQVRDGAPQSARTDINTNVPHPARIYDYWLGGKDNFAADRDAAEHALTFVPQFRTYAVGNRQFLVRAVRFLAESGIRQFLDLGTGLPTSPNVHEVARGIAPDARVVYVDNDPIVALHAAALLATNESTAAVPADFRDADDVLARARELLDFTRPVAIMFVASLHHVRDEEDPAGVVGRYLDAVVPGSHLVISHCTDDAATQGMRAGSAAAADRGVTFVPRSHAAILRLFNGRALVEPGLVPVSHWRPTGGIDPNANRALAYGGVAPISPP